jgi:hypothetical protein
MGLIWRPGFQFDADASTYIEAVETADTQALEAGVRYAINNFVIGCKQDGIWSAIKASCILAGARTLAGALVPLVGAAPTNFNFVTGDYSRKLGIKGDASSKYLSTNRNDNADPQDNQHAAVFVTESDSGSVARTLLGLGSDYASRLQIGYSGARPAVFFRSRIGTSNGTYPTNSPGLFAVSRASSSEFTYRVSKVSSTAVFSSVTPTATNIPVFGLRQTAGVSSFTDARVSFYSIGESLNLALLDGRVTDLITAIGAAIP